VPEQEAVGLRTKRCGQQAAACFSWAEKVSLDTDRERLLDMAARWLELAKEAEAQDQMHIKRE
jgi:hypothetical protein